MIFEQPTIADIQVDVMGTAKQATGPVIEEAQKQLRDVFGFELTELPIIDSKEDPNLAFVCHGICIC